MFSSHIHLFLYVIIYVLMLRSCVCEPVAAPSLVMYSPGEPEYADVLVRRVHDNLTLTCELRAAALSPARGYVWNYVGHSAAAGAHSPFTTEATNLTGSSRLLKTDLQLSDSGQYMCSAPPFSVTKYLIVQNRGPMQCARGAFWCGSRCVLVAYVCDGRTDCLHGEDEDPHMCTHNICARADKLNCSSGRCISASACCRGNSPLCQQPACCDEFTNTRDIEGYVDLEYPPLFEDRHAPDDYGFIQSTIYTVTACALIFMIAVVLLVSAICKMQMKRAALRGYTHADRTTREHYSVHYAQAHRFPPCYEASRLLEQEGRQLSPSRSPTHVPLPTDEQCAVESPVEPPRGLARLSAIFSSRYRQVPTQPTDVEMTSVRPTSPPTSPSHPHPLPLPLPLPLEYRSPTYCDVNTEFIFTNPETPELGRDLNYMATPIEFFRRRTMRRNTLERVMDQLDRQRLTLQLGRFQLSIPRFGRSEPRPDTPNVAEINIDDLDFVRLNSNETYTLNGRTIRLLGANFENYPVMPDGSVRPPSYTEAVRYKLYGPPPEYLSREGLNTNDRVDEEAASNVEMPPCYEDLSGNGAVGNLNGAVGNENRAVGSANGVVGNENGVVSNLNGAVGNVSGAVGNENGVVGNENGAVGKENGVVGNENAAGGKANGVVGNENGVVGNINTKACDVANGNCNVINCNNNSVVNDYSNENHLLDTASAVIASDNVNGNVIADTPLHNQLQNNSDSCNIETLSSIIDNLPAIDSDVNANESETGGINDHVIRDNVINNSDVNNAIANKV